MISGLLDSGDKLNEKGFFEISGLKVKFNDWNNEVFYFPLEPRKPIKCFSDTCGAFYSKKRPLRIIADKSEDRIKYKN